MDPNSSPTVPQAAAKKNILNLPTSVKLGLLLFLLSSSAVLAIYPHILKSSLKGDNYPPLSLFLVSGLIMLAFTAVLFWYLNRLKLGFGKTALVMALGYNAVIVIIKIVLSPYSLYLSDKRNPLSVEFSSDPNTKVFYLLVAVAILAVYAGVFNLIYLHYKRKMPLVPASPAGEVKKPVKSVNVVRDSLLLIVIAAVGLFLFGGSIIILPLLFLGDSSTYLTYVLGALGIPILIAVLLAIFLATRSFAAVQKEAVKTGNSTLLASFLWLGLALILIYHILWIIFMITLVQIWPFNTYSPK